MAALPSITPSYGTASQVRYAYKEAKFGDGYTVRAGDGINVRRESWSVTWEDRGDADLDTLVAFFDTLAGVTPFEWTAPRESTEKRWRCADFTRTPTGHQVGTLTAVFERYYGA